MKFAAVLSVLILGLSSSAFALREIVIVAKDGKFAPDMVELAVDEKVELLVKNEGTDAEEFESIELHREKVIPPGKSARIKIGPLKAGTYIFFGEFHPETAKGKIIVK
ncbi:cupredoxin domain-containing protein [Bdellovibrio sp. HCB337]|uniref:cupredoxin domain-containing protein n=1 Tax=Bdellovibrio sp. HCB337 TaxID=3394358 RepID=UPI0039A6EFD7